MGQAFSARPRAGGDPGDADASLSILGPRLRGDERNGRRDRTRKKAVRSRGGAALLPALAYSSRDGSIDVIGQKPRRQESLVHELGGGIGDAGAVFGMRQSLARL